MGAAQRSQMWNAKGVQYVVAVDTDSKKIGNKHITKIVMR